MSVPISLATRSKVDQAADAERRGTLARHRHQPSDDPTVMRDFDLFATLTYAAQNLARALLQLSDTDRRHGGSLWVQM